MESRKKRGGPRRALRLSIVLALGAGAGAAQAATPCEGLTALTPEESTITTAAVVGPGSVAGQNVTVAMCRVEGIARPSSDSEIKFEVWLPLAEAWTGRFKQNGTGGYAGAIPYARLAQDIGDGFVTAGSNMGHDGGESPSWTLGHPEKVKDWGLRAHYYVATAAKALADAHYGRPVAYSYFEGCSNGGRQSMMMAQNYPQLFDGIVAGAPSMFYPDLLMWLLWTGKAQIPTVAFGPPVVPTAKRVAVTQKVMAQCDGVDGLEDGQITNPAMCTFDIDSVGPAPAGDGTLTAEELEVFKKMYAGTISETGEQRYSGAVLGSEADWIPLFADNGGYGRFIGHAVYGVLGFDFRATPNLFSTVYDYTKEVLSPVTAAPSPNIDAFVARGGKLVHTHGLNDTVVPPGGSTAYYYALTQWERLRHLPPATLDQHVEKLTPQVVAATAQAFGRQVAEYHRLFLLPNVAHCGGGTGPSSIGGGMPEPPASYRNAETHAVSAVMKWVEEGVAPEKIVATRFANGVPVRQRPACAYPAQAVYDGVGDIDAASSFSCKAPKLQDREVSSGEMVLLKNALRQRELKLPNR